MGERKKLVLFDLDHTLLDGDSDVSWAQFLYPLAFTTSTTELVLPVGIITTLIKGDVFNWGQIMTGALLGAAPPLSIYAFLMDYYIAGLTAGATKG